MFKHCCVVGLWTFFFIAQYFFSLKIHLAKLLFLTQAFPLSCWIDREREKRWMLGIIKAQASFIINLQWLLCSHGNNIKSNSQARLAAVPFKNILLTVGSSNQVGFIRKPINRTYTYIYIIETWDPLIKWTIKLKTT